MCDDIEHQCVNIAQAFTAAEMGTMNMKEWIMFLQVRVWPIARMYTLYPPSLAWQPPDTSTIANTRGVVERPGTRLIRLFL